MDLVFNQQGNEWVAEFEATADFNLHIEREKSGYVEVYQRTAGGKYTHVKGLPMQLRYQLTLDETFSGLVWPKSIKVVCATEPSLAVVTTDGEVNEILSQEKEIEVTANGTTEVTPDSGFAYLSKVKVKTNVASEGGGSASGSTIEYLDVREVDYNYKLELLLNCCCSLCNEASMYPSFYIFNNWTDASSVELCAIDFTALAYGYSDKKTVKDFLIENGYTEEELSSIPRVTKEYYDSYVHIQ